MYSAGFSFSRLLKIVVGLKSHFGGVVLVKIPSVELNFSVI